MKKLPFSALLAALLAVLSAAPSSGGPLNGHVDAFGGFTGSVAFDDGLGLEGYIDFAVFTSSDFNANYSGLGYVPGDALVYTYQIESEGDMDITALKIFLGGAAANTIGSFGPLVAGEIAPFTAAFDPSDAEWVFDPPLDGVSFGLAYSSPLVPIVGSFEVFAGRASSLVALGVPVPGTDHVPVPEPATILLLGGGLMIHVRRHFRRR